MTAPSQRVLDYLEDVEYLLNVGEHPSRIAKRVGTSTAAIIKAARRAGRLDLARPFDNYRKTQR